jgi:hypothetical protein
MDQQKKPDRSTEDQRKAPLRRPWHAPEFLLTEVASTYAQANGGSDGQSATQTQS